MAKKKVTELTEEEINEKIDQCLEDLDINAPHDDFEDMYARYVNGDKVREICKDYEISPEAFYKGIKKYQDKEAGIEPETIPEPKVAVEKTKKAATPAPVTDSEPEQEPLPEHEPVKAPKASAPKEVATPKAAPARTTDDLSGVTCWRKSPDGNREYIANFVKTKGNKAANETIKITTDKKQAKVWKTMYAAVDFLCKRESDSRGWNISHK